MAKNAHTPGPWVWRGKNGGLYRQGVGGYAYGDAVLVPAYEYDTGIDTDVSEADAALIAAAPDLLNALRMHLAYEALPADRGGSSGPKGQAWAAFIAARDEALAKAEPAQ